MATHFRSGQRGLSFIGLVVVAVVVASAGLVLAQMVPTYLEYLSVAKAAKKAAGGTTIVDIRNTFDKVASIDNISAISGKDLDISKQGDKVVVAFAYQREIHLAGPVYLVMKYEGSSK